MRLFSYLYFFNYTFNLGYFNNAISHLEGPSTDKVGYTFLNKHTNHGLPLLLSHSGVATLDASLTGDAWHWAEEDLQFSQNAL